MKNKQIYIIVAILILLAVVWGISTATKDSAPNTNPDTQNTGDQGDMSLGDILASDKVMKVSTIDVSKDGPATSISSEFRCENGMAIKTMSYSGIKDPRIDVLITDLGAMQKGEMTETRTLVVRPLSGTDTETKYSTPDKKTIFGVTGTNVYLEEYGVRSLDGCEIFSQDKIL